MVASVSEVKTATRSDAWQNYKSIVERIRRQARVERIWIRSSLIMPTGYAKIGVETEDRPCVSCNTPN